MKLKKIVIFFIITVMFVLFIPLAVSAAEAVRYIHDVSVDGERKVFDVYAIDGYSYFKLRDIAYVFNGTKKQFDVAYDNARNAIDISTNKPYTIESGELTIDAGSKSQTAVQSISRIMINGSEVQLAAYTINGNNYFKLVDLMTILDFDAVWDDSSRSIVISLENIWLYFADQYNGIYKIKPDGRRLMHLCNDKPVYNNIIVFGDQIYFNLTDGIYRINVDGTCRTQVINSGWLLKADDSWVYYREADEKGIGWVYYRVKLDGSGKEFLKFQDKEIYKDELRKNLKKNGSETSNGLAANDEIVFVNSKVMIDDDWIYFSLLYLDNHYLYKSRLDGSERVLLASSVDGYIQNCVYVDGNWLYYYEIVYSEICDLYKIDTNGINGSARLMDVVPLNIIRINDDWIYYSCDYAIARFKSDGSEHSVLYDGYTANAEMRGDAIFFQTPYDGYNLFTITVDGSKCSKLTDFIVENE